MNIEKYIVDRAPNTVIYIPNFISIEEEEKLLESIHTVPKPKWTQLTHRRLQNWGGIPHKNGMICETIPDWLQKYVDKVSRLGVFNNLKANHVLINEYLPGQGIMPHLDGPLFYPTVTTISCNSHTVLEFQDTVDNDSKPICNLLIEPRSLLILQDQMYNQYLHKIDERNSDVIDESVVNLEQCSNTYKMGQVLERGTRSSLTIRHVPKTSKLKLFFGRK